MSIKQRFMVVKVGLVVLTVSSLWADEIHNTAQTGDVKKVDVLLDNPSETKPPIQYDVLEKRPIYTGNLPTDTGLRMDVLVSATTTKADALALGKYFRMLYGNDFIDIEIWDSHDVWAKKPLWNQYADAGNAQMVRAIEKEFAKHFLVKVFYNPRIKAASPDIAKTLDRIQWVAEERDQSPRASDVEATADARSSGTNEQAARILHALLPLRE